MNNVLSRKQLGIPVSYTHLDVYKRQALTPAISLITSPAIISPTTDGTNATLPGISRLSVHLCSAPGGHMQLVRQLIDISSIGLVGCSSCLLYTSRCV